MDFLDKVRFTIEKYNMLKKGDKVLIGCSGGIDSMVLLDCINKLKNEYELEIVVAHLNHMLREEAENDQQFVIDSCKRYNIRCITKKVDVLKLKEQYKLSEEEAGRIARYDFFYELTRELKLDRILLGHNKNDVVETFFLNLLRGSGLEGLASIPPVRDIISRPLIFLSRKEIEEYAKENSIAYVVDKSNLSSKYRRNIVRNELIGFIENRFNQNIIDTLFRTTQIIREENEGINRIVDEAYKECVKKEDSFYMIDIKAFNNFLPFIKKRLVRRVFKEFDYIPSSENMNTVISLLSLSSGKKAVFNHIIVEKQINELVFYKDTQKDDFCFEIPLKEEYHIKYRNLYFEFGLTLQKDEKNVVYLDASFISDKLFLRNRRNGDFIFLKLGKKKLKEFFIDNKIPKRYKDTIPLLAHDSEVIVIFDIYKNRIIINERFKVKPNTKNILKIRVTKVEGVEDIEEYREED